MRKAPSGAVVAPARDEVLLLVRGSDGEGRSALGAAGGEVLGGQALEPRRVTGWLRLSRTGAAPGKEMLSGGLVGGGKRRERSRVRPPAGGLLIGASGRPPGALASDGRLGGRGEDRLSLVSPASTSSLGVATGPEGGALGIDTLNNGGMRGSAVSLQLAVESVDECLGGGVPVAIDINGSQTMTGEPTQMAAQGTQLARGRVTLAGLEETRAVGQLSGG